ncbi:MAG: CHASE3 domain-containing protein [Thermoleophilaceae bacterium]
MRAGLTGRTALAGTVLALVIGSAFTLLLQAIDNLHDSARLAERAREVEVASGRLEQLVVDMNAALRRFVVTRDRDFLADYRKSQAAFPARADRLVAVTDRPAQTSRALRIARAGDEYILEFAQPLQSAPRAPSAETRIQIVERGDARVDQLRAQFRRFSGLQRELIATRQAVANRAARRAVIIATIGLIGSIVLILLYVAYLVRSIVSPVRRVADMAGTMAAGDLSVRLPGTSPAEIGVLERAFNSMGGALSQNVEELTASRARVVAATDEERRRVVRDLHDGAQQRLVHTIITLKLALRALQPNREPACELVAEALEHAERANVELRELVHGILPAVLTRGGLSAGLDALASRTPVPVEIDVSVGRLPTAIEATAYFVAAEALTNVAKHAHAGHAEVTARIQDGTLMVQVRDDGVGGARPDGSGLVGLADRLAALDGRLRIDSPPDGGTLLAATIPLPASPGLRPAASAPSASQDTSQVR